MDTELSLVDRLFTLAGVVGTIMVSASTLIVAQRYFWPEVVLEDHLDDVPREARFGSVERMAPISSEDHVRGDAKAPVKIVEYLDTECSFCKQSFFDMQKIFDEYDGKVALVYRHFPLPVHPKSKKEAEALECANELGGNDTFWKYADRIYQITPSGNKLDAKELPIIAEYVGLEAKAFETCLVSGKYSSHVEENRQDAIATGVNGNPWSIIVAPSGKKYPVSAVQPYAAIKQLIEIALKDMQL